jgi:hypothetical protein
MSMITTQYVTISVRPATKSRLVSHGKKGEVFDDLLSRVLDGFEADKKRAEVTA